MDAIETFETRIGEQWKEITGGKNLKREEKFTLLFSWLAKREIRTSITENEAKKMLSLLTENIDEHEQIIEDFIDTIIPFDYQESILGLWTILHKEINTLNNKKTPLATRIQLLKEMGCNIITTKRKQR